MTASKLNQVWTLITILLVAIIFIGGMVAWSRYSRPHPVEISIPPTQELQGEGYIAGAVNNPGFYTLKSGDSIEDLIQAAGGTIGDTDLSGLRIYIPKVGEEAQPQKIDLNRAEAWLLEALPSIGQSKAQAIIDYRQQIGAFRNIRQLTEVEGIGPATYEQIKHLITVAD
ncbi:MAG: helix-hairpin-helix domain-containing protein [Dehalococcoidia bacterium]|nr:helix-hairpin-helix domain-containing protein [Dehalococcoidia bacterium]